MVISLHDSLCWTCRGDGEPIPDGLCSSLAPPSLSIAIPDSSPNLDDPFLVVTRTFHLAEGPEGFVWTNKERAVMQAFFAHYESEVGVDVVILEAGVRDRSPGGDRVLPEGAGLGEGRDGA